MKTAEMREKSVEELKKREVEIAEQLFALRIQKVTGQLEKPSKVKEVKKELARVLTVLKEKQA